MKKEPQYYSKIARKWTLDKRASEGHYWTGVYWCFILKELVEEE